MRILPHRSGGTFRDCLCFKTARRHISFGFRRHIRRTRNWGACEKRLPCECLWRDLDWPGERVPHSHLFLIVENNTCPQSNLIASPITHSLFPVISVSHKVPDAYLSFSGSSISVQACSSSVSEMESLSFEPSSSPYSSNSSNQETDDGDSVHVSVFWNDMEFVILRDDGFSNVVNLLSIKLSVFRRSFILPSSWSC